MLYSLKNPFFSGHSICNNIFCYARLKSIINIKNSLLLMVKKLVSVLPDFSGLSGLEENILFFIFEKWPTTPLEIAEYLNEDISSRENKRRMSTKYSYYLKKLIKKQLIVSKRAGNSVIVWPLVVEKYRTIHNILQDYEKESSSIISKKGDIVA